MYDVTSPSWKPGASAAEWLKYRPDDLPTKPCGDKGWIYSDKFYFSTVVTEVMIRAMLSCADITYVLTLLIYLLFHSATITIAINGLR